MNTKIFILLLVTIALFGLTLRIKDYDRIPHFTATQDEFFYPWAGMTLLQTGTPKAWSWFNAYKTRQVVNYWNVPYPIVVPWVEKPPLYSLLTGLFVLFSGANSLHDVRLSTIRIIPVFLSLFTIILTGLLAKSLFGSYIALIAALLYATIPTIVIGNRFSLVENLLTPLVLLAIYFYSLNKKIQKYKPYLIGFVCGLAVLTKNIGIALPIIFLAIFIYQKKWREFIIIGLITLVFALIHPLMGLYYDWDLFIAVLREYQQTHALVGLPELVETIFRFPIVGHKDRLFIDGAMLAGYILLFSSPFWIKKDLIVEKEDYLKIFLGFPFIYIVLLSLLESGGTDFSYFGWHVFPIFPFLTIFIAKALGDVWQNPDLFKTIFFYLILGASSIRFSLLFFPQYQKSWQGPLLLILIILVISFVRPKFQKMIFLFLFIIFLFINVFVILNLDGIYLKGVQPLN